MWGIKGNLRTFENATLADFELLVPIENSTFVYSKLLIPIENATYVDFVFLIFVQVLKIFQAFLQRLLFFGIVLLCLLADL